MPRHGTSSSSCEPMTRGEDRREAADEGEPREHPHEGQPAEQVTHDRHRDDAARGRTDALQHAEDERATRCSATRKTPRLAPTCTRRRDDERQAPPDPVAPRTDEQLPEREAEGRRRERQLHGRRRHAEVGLDDRERRAGRGRS